MGNPVIHFEIGTNDIKKSTEFFTSLFDWRPTINDIIGYNTIDCGVKDSVTGAILQVSQEVMHPYVTFYVEVDDIHKCLDQVQQLGGEVILNSTPLEGTGSIAMFRDPDGNPIGLFEPLE